ncbi:MAG: hypothetical protein HDS75_04460 [Bacteroidales bacterium]|nr:hypothetical protein [Bacteroidales bacterium]MDE6802267.1 hypothetical protein [Muribaculaceae bacterium]
MDKFTKLINPLFSFLDSGKLFKQPLMYLYYALGVAMCLLGIYFIVDNFDSFSYMPGAVKFYTIMMMLVLLAACVFSLMFWFHRANDLKNERFDETRFIAIPVVASLIRSIGEFLGLVLAYLGVCSGILTILILSFEDSTAIGLGLGELFGGAIAGYLLLVFFRYSAELILAIAAIANNTKDAVDELRKK